MIVKDNARQNLWIGPPCDRDKSDPTVSTTEYVGPKSAIKILWMQQGDFDANKLTPREKESLSVIWLEDPFNRVDLQNLRQLLDVKAETYLEKNVDGTSNPGLVGPDSPVDGIVSREALRKLADEACGK